MGKKIKWGILGPGSIAHRFVEDLQMIPDAEVAAVGSRSMERANAFGDQYDIPRRYGDYQSLAEDDDIDVVYVATPHPYHMECTIQCLNAGKGVLCEKPMAINAAEIEKMIQSARKNKVFLMEAMWSRFLPMMVKVREWLAEGRIGDIQMVTADFGFRSPWNPESRILNPNLAGGAILDVGIYIHSFASMIFGGPPARMAGMTHLGETKVDEQSVMILGYEKGAMAVLTCAVRTSTPHEARIIGTKGSIYIPGFWHATSAHVQVQGEEAEHVEIPYTGTGFHYEAEEVMRCIREGLMESPVLPLEESLSIMQTLDWFRKDWGLKFPMEP